MKKEKRGPELWYKKHKKSSTDDSQKEDDVYLGAATRSRSKFPPGPDLATAVADEFYNLQRSKCSEKSGSASEQAVPTQQQPLSGNRKAPAHSIRVGNVGTHQVADKSRPMVPEIEEEMDDLDELPQSRNGYNSDSLADLRTEDWMREEPPPTREYELKRDDAEHQQRRSGDYIRSPHKSHRRPREYRRYTSSDSDDSGRRRKRSRRTKRRRSRRSSSRSTSSYSPDRGERRRSKDYHDICHGYKRQERPLRDPAPQSMHDGDIFEQDNQYSRHKSPGSYSGSRADVRSPQPRGYELKVPLRNYTTGFQSPDRGISEQGRHGPSHSSCTLHAFSLSKESADRKERRDRHRVREEAAQRRVEAGKKKYYVCVNEDGHPYGKGVGLWNETVGKLVRGLDPSYIDIRQQPFHLMENLIARLNDDFDYSDNVNSAWLRKRIGSALSSYRHELMKIIDAKEARPQWVSEEIWTRLVTMANSESHRTKSEQMRYANACRITKGRTGPIGIAGVTEKLRTRLGRTPDPDEIQEEVTRDKSGDRRPRHKIGGGVTQPAVADTVGENSRGIAEVSTAASTHVTGNVANSVDAVPTDMKTAAPLTEEHIHDSAEGPAITLSRVLPIKKSVVTGNVSVMAGTSSQKDVDHSAAVLETDPNSDSGDPDIVFARDHPLGKVLLKQMAELKSIPGCKSTQLQLVLDGIMLQIRNMRTSCESAGAPREEAISPLHHDDIQFLGNKELDEFPVPCTQVNSLPPSSYLTPADDPVETSEPAPSLHKTNNTIAITRKSGRKPKPKNRDG